MLTLRYPGGIIIFSKFKLDIDYRMKEKELNNEQAEEIIPDRTRAFAIPGVSKVKWAFIFEE